MTSEQIKDAVQRILSGERATLVVKPENAERAREMRAKLSPRLQGLLTIQVIDNCSDSGIGRVSILDPNGPGVIGEDPRFAGRPRFAFSPGEKIPSPKGRV